MFFPYGMGLQHFHGTGSRPLLWPGSRAAVGETAVNGTPNCINYRVIFIVYTQFTNVAAGRRLGTHALRCGTWFYTHTKKHGGYSQFSESCPVL